jgi:hypothetical protein
MMCMKRKRTLAAIASLGAVSFVLAGMQVQAQKAVPREPRGVYAVVLSIDNRPYQAAIDNPAISGLFLYFQWSRLEPQKGQFDFAAVEDAFRTAEAAHKTVQIALIPGFWSPSWLLGELRSCDEWLASGGRTGAAPTRCGKATFSLPEGVALKGEMHELPLPWNPVYKRAWHELLVEFARRFGQREALVSIAIAGPTAQSEEIIMPHLGPGETEKWARLLEAFYPDPSYHRSSRAFVEEWEAAIDDYERTFSNLTLALTLAGGLPFNPPRQREASTLAIIDYFAARASGPNAKATQNNGVKAARPLTMQRVKEMAADGRIKPRVLAGGEFATGFARDPARQGCPIDNPLAPACQRTTPEQALANDLAVFFAGTRLGRFFGAQDGPAPIQYLQIYQGDVFYANEHPQAQAMLLEASRRILSSAAGQ